MCGFMRQESKEYGIKHFEIKDFGPIGSVSVDFGDLTIVVGPQACGKSVFLETLKLVVDHDHVLDTLERYNYIIGHDAEKVLNVFFGDGLSGMWKKKSLIKYGDDNYSLSGVLSQKSNGQDEMVFYIPAQRIMSISDGRPKNFMEFDSSAPYVLRMFSETLRLFLQYGMGSQEVLFPQENRLKVYLRTSFNKNIFHDGRIVMEERMGQKKMLLSVDGLSIPFMAWSAGQKEFMPLLLGFYCLSGPPSKVIKKEKYKYVVIEEPEMGLHPQAIVSLILQMMELIQCGYKVIVSSHSPVFLEFAWAFNSLKDNIKYREKALHEIFGIEGSGSPVIEMLNGIFDKSIRAYYFRKTEGEGKVESLDISSLDVCDDNRDIAGWGGLSDFSSKVSDVVSKYLIGND